MKIISLNAWGGRVHKELMDFLKKNENIDVFCFQEIYHRADYVHVEQGEMSPNLNLFDDIQKVLPNHIGHFRPHYNGDFGLAVFVKKDLEVKSEEDYFVHKYRDYMPKGDVGHHGRNVQAVVLKTDSKDLNIFNLHGLWNGGGKLDSEDRLNQSKMIIEYMKKYDGPKVLCGDFNLEPQTESIKLIENAPMRNLIKESRVTSTRSSYYKHGIRFADYAFVSDDVEVVGFEVLSKEVSDHLALMLEINI